YSACSATGDRTADSSGDGGSSVGNGSGNGSGVGSGSLSAGAGGGLIDPCTGVHCSSDLHSLVDCDGNVVMDCPSDMGCSGSSCVTACNSASDNKSTFGCDYYVVG